MGEETCVQPVFSTWAAEKLSKLTGFLRLNISDLISRETGKIKRKLRYRKKYFLHTHSADSEVFEMAKFWINEQLLEKLTVVWLLCLTLFNSCSSGLEGKWWKKGYSRRGSDSKITSRIIEFSPTSKTYKLNIVSLHQCYMNWTTSGDTLRDQIEKTHWKLKSSLSRFKFYEQTNRQPE